MDAKEYMAAGEIRVEPIPFLEIDKLELVKRINRHTYLEVQGKINDTDKEGIDYLNAAETQLTVKRSDGTVLFVGILTEIEIKDQGNVFTITIHACSYTILLDRKKRTRPFHDIKQTAEELIRRAAKGTPHTDTLIDESCDAQIGQFIMQYEETDWEFIKRLASCCRQSVYPDGQTGYPAFYVGKLKAYSTLDIDANIPCVCCRKGYKDDGTPFVIHCLELDGEWLELGECVYFNGIELYVKALRARLEHAVLKNRYELCSKSDMGTERLYNTTLAGKSVTGTVTDIKRDRVCVNISSDNSDTKDEACWFPYSTIYASENGSGWYCMPEIGDRVRIQFPDENEKNAYAVSSVSEYQPTASAGDRMEDYTRRYIRNRQGMQVMWTPERVMISSNGACLVDVNQNGTLSISADSKIIIHSERDVQIEAGSEIDISGGGGIHIQCGAKAEIDMGTDGILTLKGNEIFTN